MNKSSCLLLPTRGPTINSLFSPSCYDLVNYKLDAPGDTFVIDQILQLKNLTVLFLCLNTGVVPDLGQLPMLYYLQLTTASPPTLSNTTVLDLVISFSSWNALWPNMSSIFPHLQTLNIISCPWLTTWPTPFPRIQKLSIVGSRFTRLPEFVTSPIEISAAGSDLSAHSSELYIGPMNALTLFNVTATNMTALPLGICGSSLRFLWINNLTITQWNASFFESCFTEDLDIQMNFINFQAIFTGNPVKSNLTSTSGTFRQGIATSIFQVSRSIRFTSVSGISLPSDPIHAENLLILRLRNCKISSFFGSFTAPSLLSFDLSFNFLIDLDAILRSVLPSPLLGRSHLGNLLFFRLINTSAFFTVCLF